MYQIIRTKVFERSYKKLKQSGVKGQVIADVQDVIDTLALGKPLAIKHRDHELTGYF